MINNIGQNFALQFNSNIRTTASTEFDRQMSCENIFEDKNTKTKEEIRNEKINFSNLGAPAGFFLDTSLLEEQANEGPQEPKAPKNPYTLIN